MVEDPTQALWGKPQIGRLSADGVPQGQLRQAGAREGEGGIGGGRGGKTYQCWAREKVGWEVRQAGGVHTAPTTHQGPVVKILKGVLVKQLYQWVHSGWGWATTPCEIREERVGCARENTSVGVVVKALGGEEGHLCINLDLQGLPEGVQLEEGAPEVWGRGHFLYRMARKKFW